MGIPYEYIDGRTDSVKVIELDHHEIHEEHSFTCHYSNDVTERDISWHCAKNIQAVKIR